MKKNAPSPAQKIAMRPMDPYIQSCLLFETPKVGKKPGRKLSETVWVGDSSGSAVDDGCTVVLVGAAELVDELPFSVGFALIGRTGWSVGVVGKGVGRGSEETLVVTTGTVAVS